MQNYTVYFEIYGKKMKTKILAENPLDAKEKIKQKIIFHKIEQAKNDNFNNIMNMFDDIIKK